MWHKVRLTNRETGFLQRPGGHYPAFLTAWEVTVPRQACATEQQDSLPGRSRGTAHISSQARQELSPLPKCTKSPAAPRWTKLQLSQPLDSSGATYELQPPNSNEWKSHLGMTGTCLQHDRFQSSWRNRGETGPVHVCTCCTPDFGLFLNYCNKHKIVMAITSMTEVLDHFSL